MLTQQDNIFTVSASNKALQIASRLTQEQQRLFLLACQLARMSSKNPLQMQEVEKIAAELEH